MNLFRYCETAAYYQKSVCFLMDDSSLLQPMTTEGVVIGHELAEWAGFISGRVIIKKNDGTRVEFRFGKESQGTIPKIGSLVSIQHPVGIHPEVIKISFLGLRDIYKGNDSFLDSILMGRSSGVSLIVLAAIGGGLTMILIGLLSAGRTLPALVIFGLCGVLYVIIGYLLWIFTGE